MSVEVKIGITDSPRELTIQSADSSDDVYQSIEDALGGKQALLTLTDEKGARFVVPVSKVAYVEVGKSEARKVGFGAA
ncbi:DUF3107 domain-containing protein [Gordonia sp. CPCC 205333]|uniref:DUF3107 domain-containing protein n=1 Tax=Gordonia sp. CPCC 205333 TaxID=3140790 RepID=UPI003AF37557